jgi:hypothetical protein
MPYIFPPNISLNSNSPIHTHSTDSSNPLRLHEDINQTTPITHPHHSHPPAHLLPIVPTTYDELREIFDTLRIANTVHSDHHQSVSSPLNPPHAPLYTQLTSRSNESYHLIGDWIAYYPPITLTLFAARPTSILPISPCPPFARAPAPPGLLSLATPI